MPLALMHVSFRKVQTEFTYNLCMISNNKKNTHSLTLLLYKELFNILFPRKTKKVKLRNITVNMKYVWLPDRVWSGKDFHNFILKK